jgi:ABC-type uncharacterized transport system involved in gliding motility auxiliary subunit
LRRPLLVLAAVSVIALALYASVSRAGVAVDLTAEDSATLSEATRVLLRDVDSRVHITAFFPRGSAGRVEAATLLSRYRDANRKITFDILDPVIVPGEAERLGVTDVGSSAVEDLTDDDVEIAQYTIEIDITSAIARLQRDVTSKVCFSEGHGERPTGEDEPKGIAQSAALLQGNGYQIDTFNLLADPSVPKSCDAVVMAAPKTTFSREARKALSAYLEASGKLFVLADPDATTDLTSVTKRWGISFLGGVVVEGNDGAHLPDDLTAPIVTRYAGGSPVVRGLGPTFFPRVMGVDGKGTDDPGLTVTELASTSAVSYLDRNDFERFDPKLDVEGPIAIGASADDSEVKRADSSDAAIARTRVLAWGDVDFATNAFIGDGANAQLFVQGVDWLTQAEDLVAAVPQFPQVRELELTQARSRYVLFLMGGVIPALWVIGGLLVWAVRRSR